MRDLDRPVAAVLFSNATAGPLRIWLEPWVDEFMLPPRSELALHVTMEDGRDPIYPDIECTDELIAIYGAGGSLIRVLIDGVEQEGASARLASPDFGALNARSFVQTVFGEFPEARPGGLPLPTPRPHGWFDRWFGRPLRRPN